MYAVSEAYFSKMDEPNVEREIKGTIGNITFSKADIVQNSLFISNQCSESGTIKLGAVYTAELECTFRNGLIDRETWKGLKIEIAEGIRFDDGSVEYVPLGVYFVDEAAHGEYGVSIKAYDAMLKFERPITVDQTYGAAYALIKMACQNCGVDLENSAQSIRQFPNAEEELWLYAENDVETWRDLLYWIGQALCGFWTINRKGRLELRRYGMSVRNAIPSTMRYKDASFSDYVTRYTGISIVKAESNEELYFAIQEDDALTYTLGANPLLQYGSDEDMEKRCRAILGELQNIEYIPFSASVLHGAPYDLGDVIRFVDGRADSDKVSCVMLWEYDGNKIQLAGYGTNPATVSARTSVDKKLQGLVKSMGQDEIQYYIFSNSKNITVMSEEKKKIIDIRFASNKPTMVLFQAEILLDVNTNEIDENYYECHGRVTYLYNDNELEEYHPEETWVDGKHILHLAYPFKIESATMSHLEVLLASEGGSIRIGAGNIKSYVYGQALVATQEWDGTLKFEDKLECVEIRQIPRVRVLGLTGTIVTEMQMPILRGPADQISIVQIKPMQRISMMELTDEEIEATLKEVET